MRKPVLINWGISSLFGWGVYGLNLALAWAGDPAIAPAGLFPIDRARLVIDALRMATLSDFFAATERAISFKQQQGPVCRFDATLLACLGNNLAILSEPSQDVSGSPTIGVAFFEDTSFTEGALLAARAMPCIVAGSTWNANILRDRGLPSVVKIIQGVDTSLFHPAARLGLLPDRFKIFSGGKLEFRKGQDIVMAAVSRFIARHPDALLVTAWHSPWEDFGRSVDASGRAAPVTYDAQGRLDVKAWGKTNGIADHQFLDIGRVPNGLMPPLLREMDVALFPNRAEGGTNLVAMECMACGVPTILSANTGHLDLIDDLCCYPLLRQSKVPSHLAGVNQTSGWGDSDLDEIVETLERAYQDRHDAQRRGAAGADKLSNYTWKVTADKLKDVVLSTH